MGQNLHLQPNRTVHGTLLKRCHITSMILYKHRKLHVRVQKIRLLGTEPGKRRGRRDNGTLGDHGRYRFIYLFYLVISLESGQLNVAEEDLVVSPPWLDSDISGPFRRPPNSSAGS